MDRKIQMDTEYWPEIENPNQESPKSKSKIAR